jgi:HK97 family phage major capsid protein
MNLKEQLETKKKELAELEPTLKSEDVTTETVEQGEKLASEIEELTEKIEKAEKANAILKTLGTTEEPNTDTQEVTKMTDLEQFTKSAKEMTDRKAGVKMQLKAASDVVTSAQIADVDRSVAPQPTRSSVADYFTNATIEGNAITYFMQGAYEGTPAVTAEGAKKPQNSTSFEGITLPLSKIAAYIKETDEILYDEPFLASEVQNALIYQIGKVKNSTIIGAIAGTSGIGAAEYDAAADETLADGVLAAILGIKADSAYDASVVFVNPADLYKLMSAKDQNGQYIGGGYFTGAYGNGQYNMPTSIWGVPVFASSEITAGEALVAAREAVKIWQKGGIDVRLFEQNEDDAIYNRVTLVGEERLAVAVVDLKGVYAVEAKA